MHNPFLLHLLGQIFTLQSALSQSELHTHPLLVQIPLLLQ